MDMVDILGLLLMLSMTQLGHVRKTRLTSFLIWAKPNLGISHCESDRRSADHGLRSSRLWSYPFPRGVLRFALLQRNIESDLNL